MPSDPDPYYQDDLVTLYLGDSRELVAELLPADAVVVTDPPYGIGWSQGDYNQGRSHDGILGDADTSTRDVVLAQLGDTPGAVFGDWRHPVETARAALVYAKARDSGIFGTFGGFRRDWEMIYLVGCWPDRPAASSSILSTSTWLRSGGDGQHPHRKPLDVLAQLIAALPGGVIVDPFAGSGSTLVAAKLLGRRAIGIELDARWCERAARRCAQGVLGL